MKKTLFVLALLGFYAALASAQVAFNTPNASGTIAVNATIQQSASVILSGSTINFNVTNPGVATNGDNSITVQGMASLAKHHSAVYTVSSSDLTGINGGGTIPAALVSGKTNLSAGYASLDPNAGGFYPLSLQAQNGVLNQKEGLAFTLSLQLAPVPNFVPDQYVGTVTVLLQVQ